jgi:uncharacterized protein (TIGR02145 family)
MRRLLLSLVFLLTGLISFSQNTGVGVGTTSPHPSAELDVNSTSKGFLPPRMTYAQRNGISNPAAGLMIWCSDCLPKGEVQVFNGSEWTNMTGGTAAVNYVQLPSVTIGTQIWQSKNLDVATYRNGNPIPQITDPTQWANLTTGAWCWYNNDSATYAATYGRMYNWYAVADSQGLCPTGWHVPTDAEWAVLENELGGSSIAGGALKSTTGIGFSGLLGGFRYNYGLSNFIGIFVRFWSSTEYSTGFAWYRSLYNSESNVFRNNYFMQGGCYVRCVRD